MSQDLEKQLVGEAAAKLVDDGMKVGIGTGSTADCFTRALGQRVADGLRIIGVPTSIKTEKLATELNIPLTTLEDAGALDMTIDGADEADHALRLIKGGGGALLREKIVAKASDQMIVITDASKLVEKLGAFKLPVEVNPFGKGITKLQIEEALPQFCTGIGDVSFREAGGDLFLTDGGHHIVDCDCGVIDDPEGLHDFLNGLPGVVENGLFIGMASKLLIARGDKVEVLD